MVAEQRPVGKRLVERDDVAGRQRFGDRRARQGGRGSQLADARLVSGLRQQVAGGPDLPPALEQRPRDPHEAAAGGDGVRDGRPDAPEGVGGEARPASGVVLVDRRQETDRAFLHEILDGHAEVAVAEGDGADEAHVFLDDGGAGDAVAAASASRESFGMACGVRARRRGRRRRGSDEGCGGQESDRSAHVSPSARGAEGLSRPGGPRESGP